MLLQKIARDEPEFRVSMFWGAFCAEFDYANCFAATSMLLPPQLKSQGVSRFVFMIMSKPSNYATLDWLQGDAEERLKVSKKEFPK